MTVAVAAFVWSARDVTVTITVFGLGAVAGAVYRPLLLMAPQEAPEQPGPLRVQETNVFPVPDTAAVNCC